MLSYLNALVGVDVNPGVVYYVFTRFRVRGLYNTVLIVELDETGIGEQ